MIDKTILKLVAKGDKRAFDVLYKNYHQKIFAFALSYFKNEEDAYDLVQEVFIKIWNNRDKLGLHSNPDAYIFAISRNSIISQFRKRSNENDYLKYLKEKSSTNSIGAEELCSYNFLTQYYKDLISQLPPRRREIFVLSRKNGLLNREIAEQLKISEKTVENQLTKAISFFRKKLGGDKFFFSASLFLFIWHCFS
ncbi:RNA polymerase sigma-70 factor [Marinilabiliaceae bacterium ANBcel2]|nr:RNA polymerase sigma-70 factor [Marinilabiliaceae bacterium ANBcel2]